ncbi:MAG: hypothetical protein HRT64_13800, partial [Erythrobacter sp.]|nr:hypothetical protein [Erythrobacter sp.]
DDLDPELLNRCLVMSVDESADQTAAILGRQRERCTLDGLAAADAAAAIRTKHHHAQRLLQPLRVVIPQAPQLTFATHLPRLRRDHMKYINLIRCVALLHQFQRDVFTHESGFRYIEATAEDIAAANEIIAEVLGRSIAGMLPHTRELLELIDRFVGQLADSNKIERSAVRFTRRQLREWCGWGDTRLRKHLARLQEWEVIEAQRNALGSFSYALHYTPADRQRSQVRLHLIDPGKLPAASNEAGRPAPLEGQSAPHAHPDSTGDAPHVHPEANEQNPVKNGEIMILPQEDVKQRHYGGDVSGALPSVTVIDAQAASASPTSRGEGAA